MKPLIQKFKNNFSYAVPVLLCCLLSLSSCKKSWERSELSELESKKVPFKIQVTNRADASPMPHVRIAVSSKLRGEGQYKVVFEGESDANGLLTIPNFEVPSLVELQMTDTRFPVAKAVAMKVLGEASASATLEVSTTWSEQHIYDRSDWTVISVSSQQTTSGGLNAFKTGTATWHTQYSPVMATFPHTFIFDMQHEKAIHGFALKQRASNNGPIKGLEFHASNDAQNWTKVLDTEIPYTNPGVWHVLPTPQEAKGRYIKMVITSGHLVGTTFINLEELGVF